MSIRRSFSAGLMACMVVGFTGTARGTDTRGFTVTEAVKEARAFRRTTLRNCFWTDDRIVDRKHPISPAVYATDTGGWTARESMQDVRVRTGVKEAKPREPGSWHLKKSGSTPTDKRAWIEASSGTGRLGGWEDRVAVTFGLPEVRESGRSQIGLAEYHQAKGPGSRIRSRRLALSHREQHLGDRFSAFGLVFTGKRDRGGHVYVPVGLEAGEIVVGDQQIVGTDGKPLTAQAAYAALLGVDAAILESAKKFEIPEGMRLPAGAGAEPSTSIEQTELLGAMSVKLRKKAGL